MPNKTIQNGSVLRVEEYEVRLVNAQGESYDVSHFEKKNAAVAYAKQCVEDGQVAAEVERHTSYHPARFGENKYRVVAQFGSAQALALYRGEAW